MEINEEIHVYPKQMKTDSRLSKPRFKKTKLPYK